MLIKIYIFSRHEIKRSPQHCHQKRMKRWGKQWYNFGLILLELGMKFLSKISVALNFVSQFRKLLPIVIYQMQKSDASIKLSTKMETNKSISSKLLSYRELAFWSKILVWNGIRWLIWRSWTILEKSRCTSVIQAPAKWWVLIGFVPKYIYLMNRFRYHFM